jgi:hypothetical protein
VSLFNARDKQLIERDPYLKLEKPSEEGLFVIDPNALQRVVHEVLDAKKTDTIPNYRTRLNDCRWRVQNLLNVVDEQHWAKMVEASITGMLKTINNSQPNGTWVPCGYETRITNIGKDKEAFLELVVQFVDTTNSPEMMYQDGRPVVNVTVQNPTLDSSIIDTLNRKAEGDPEMKALLAALVQQQAMMASFIMQQSGQLPSQSAKDVAAPVVEPVEPVEETISHTISVDDDLPATPVRKGGRKTKAVEPTSDIDPAALDALAFLPVEE